jgi:uncharacterized RDD family membrane protein YckC
MPRPEPPDEPLLFDLPLDTSERSRSAATPAPERKRPSPVKPRPEPAQPPLAADPGPEAQEEEAAEPSASGRSGAGSRFAAGAADLLVHAAVTVLLLVGTRMMGVRPALADWPALAAFLLAFSFLYMVVPLAFWGHTLGMAWAGLVARNRDGEPLTFDQTARRWLGGLLTLALAGLPLLFAGAGRSLTDLVSGSATYPSRGAA